MADNNTQQNPTVVNTVLAKAGFLIAAIQSILQEENDSDKNIFNQLGYKFNGDTLHELDEIKDEIIKVAKEIELLVRDLIGIDYGQALDDIQDFKISSELKDVFKTGKDLVKVTIDLVKTIKAFSDSKKAGKLYAFFANDNLQQEFVERLCDHVLISVLRKIEADEPLFIVPNGREDNTSESGNDNKGFKDSAFARSIKIITASLDLLCMMDTEEVEVIYQSGEETEDTVKLNVVRWGVIEDLIEKPVPTLKTMYSWEEISSAKKLFNNFKKLFLAISNDKYSEYFTPVKWLELVKSWIPSTEAGKKIIEKIDDILECLQDDKKKNDLINNIEKQQSSGSATPSGTKKTTSSATKRSPVSTGVPKVDFNFDISELNFALSDDEIELYFIAPINKVLKANGINSGINDIRSNISDLNNQLTTHIRDKITEIKGKGISDWAKFIWDNKDKIKIDTDDFDVFESFESIVKLCLDEIVQVDEIKKIISQMLADILADILNKVDDLINKVVLKKHLLQQLMIEIAGRVVQNLIIPKLAPAMEAFTPYIKEVVNVITGLSQIYDDIQNFKYKDDVTGKILSGLQICINVLKSLSIPEGILEQIPALKAFNAIKDKWDSVTIDPDSQLVSVQLYDFKSEKGDKNLSVALNMILLTEKPKKTALVIYPKVAGKLNEEIAIGEDHKLKINLAGELNNNALKIVGIKLTKDDVVFESDEGAISASFILEFLRTKSLEVYTSDYLDINIENYPQKFEVEYDEKNEKYNFDLKYSSKLEGLEIVLKKQFFADKVWSFIADLVKDDIRFSVDTTMSYSLQNGFKFAGSPKLNASFDFKKSFSVIDIDGFNIDVGTNGFNLSKLNSSLSTNLSLNIAGVTLTAKEMGVKMDVDITKSITLSSFDFEFKYPTGLGIAIDNDAVKGAGFISYDEENKRFIGAIELNILEKVDLGAYVIFDTSLPKEQGGFAFMALLMVSGLVVPLGFDFYLVGIGGALGLNRRINEKAVQSGVYDGTIETAFLAEDLQKNMGQIEKITDSYFLIKKHQFFLGIITKIDFNQPAIVSGELGLFLQFPSPFQIIIFGGMHVALPEKAETKAIVLNLYFAGGIDFSKGLWFDASLRDSKIGFLEIYGDLSLRIAWGETKGFAITAGGFHPAYTPSPELGLPKTMRRLGIKLDNSLVKLKFETYFALTTNTVQFGAALNVSADIKVVSIDGHLSFDALFIFSPFSFMVDVRAGVRVKVFRITLCSIGLEFRLSGTTPWRAKGKAHFKIFLLGSFSPSFNEKWGKSGEEIAPQEEDIFPILSEEYARKKNWSVTVEKEDSALVQLADIPGDKLVLHPLGRVVFKQEKVPLDQHLDSYGKKVPGDYNKFEIDSINLGKDEVKKEKTMGTFIPANFKKMTDEQKLAAPSFVEMVGGFNVVAKQNNTCKDTTLNLDYECECDDVTLSVIDSNNQFVVCDEQKGEETYIANFLLENNEGEGQLSAYNDSLDDGGFEAGSHTVFTKNIRAKQKEQKVTLKTKEDIYRIYSRAKKDKSPKELDEIKKLEKRSFPSFVDAINCIKESGKLASEYIILLEKKEKEEETKK